MEKNTVKLNEAQLRKIVAESVKKALMENIDCADFYNYVIKRFNEEGIEIGDAGDSEELFQGCSAYDYETVPFEQLYDNVKNDWLTYKSEQKQYHGISENAIRKVDAESINRVLKESDYDNETMRARIPSRVMPSADRLPGHGELENPYIPTAKQIRGATDAAYKMNKIVKKFVYEAEEANESWTIDSLAQEIFSKFSKINGFQYGAPHVYEFTIEDIRKRITAYVKKVYNNLFYFEENGNI